MLPSELLRVVRWKDRIQPKYARLADLTVAEAVVRVYQQGVGMKRGALREAISDLEGEDYKLVRGLAALVERKCVFASEAPVDPFLLRHALFALAAAGFSRENALNVVAKEFRLSPEQVDACIYADLESETILKEAPAIAPMELLRQYNLSLTQTLLFHSTGVEFTAGGNWQRIFRAIKCCGLMYTVNSHGGNFTVNVDGPTSILKLTKQYGIALAKVVPEVLRGKLWTLYARILWCNKLLLFALVSAKHSWLFPEQNATEEYDSAVEADFASRFKALGTEWTIHREAEPIITGTSVLIPDFTFKFGDVTVHMEIVGFWTKDYLKRKLEKLSMIKDIRFIIAVDEELACEKLARLTSETVRVIYYKGKIPVKTVLDYLRPLAEEVVKKQASSFKLALDGDVVPLKDAAEKAGVSAEAAKRAVLETHELVGECFMSKRLLSEINSLLDKLVQEEMPLPKVLGAIKEYGLLDPLPVITHCGFRIKWHGLLPENAIVQRSDRPLAHAKKLE